MSSAASRIFGPEKRALLKIDRSDDELKELEKYDLKHETLGLDLFWLEIATHRFENLSPPEPLKMILSKIREDPTRYLRDSLVKDCISRGGCCGRDCRCCENRH